jgi:hypothetical protein
VAGRFEDHVVDSTLLRGNPLGDPHERPLTVYLPPGYDGSGRAYPVVYVIQGFTGQVGMWRNQTAWRPSYPDLIADLFADGDVPPVIVVFVDAWTRLGGSQFVDSPATGRYHSYLCDEVVPFVDARFRTLPEARHRAITGKSSGGYGAMITPMLRPDLFGALATHAGDALFENCHQTEFANCARTLRDSYDGDWDAFVADFFSGRIVGTKSTDHELIEMYAYAAAYSPTPDGRVELPFDDLGLPIPELWDRWLAADPVRMVPGHAEAVRGLHSLWIDAGTSDEYFLDLGATAYHRAVLKAGVAPENIHFELFDAGHRAIEYRYPLALAWLARRLQP